MTCEEVVNLLEQLKAEIEWDYSLEYQIALEEAIKACIKVHDLTELLLGVPV